MCDVKLMVTSVPAGIILACLVGRAVRFVAACCGRRGAGQPLAVEWDDDALRVLAPSGVVTTIRWNAVCGIAIRTTDEGPWYPDVFWLIEAADGHRVIVPQEAQGEDGMLEAMQRRFPGMDDEALIAAMGCTDNALFTLWRRVDGLTSSASRSAAPSPATSAGSHPAGR